MNRENRATSKAMWWQPKFSVRAMLLLVTLVCVYAACWRPTSDYGMADVKDFIDAQPAKRCGNTELVAPLVVEVEEYQYPDEPVGYLFSPAVRRCYYVWFFGYVAKLPWERSVA